MDFEKSLIKYERTFTPNLKKTNFNYYDLKSYIQDPNISVVVAEKNGSLIASGYALVRLNKIYKNPSHIVFLGFMYVVPECRGLGINKKILDYLIKWGQKKGIQNFSLMFMRQIKAQSKLTKKLDLILKQ